MNPSTEISTGQAAAPQPAPRSTPADAVVAPATAPAGTITAQALPQGARVRVTLLVQRNDRYPSLVELCPPPGVSVGTLDGCNTDDLIDLEAEVLASPRPIVAGDPVSVGGYAYSFLARLGGIVCLAGVDGIPVPVRFVPHEVTHDNGDPIVWPS